MCLLLVALLLITSAPARAAGVGPPDPMRFASELRAFMVPDSLPGSAFRPIVFYGSSSIRMWHDRLATDFAPQWVIGRGFGGSTMSEAAFWVDRVVAPLRPSIVVLYEGDNDIEMGRTPQQVARDFDLLVAKLRVGVPRAHLFVLSIKPSGSRWAKWQAMQEANRRLREACDRRPDLMTFVDVGSVLLGPDGRPRSEMYLADRLHLSARGYDAWRAIVQSALEAQPVE